MKKEKEEKEKGNKCRTIINIQFDMKTHKVSSVINMPKQLLCLHLLLLLLSLLLLLPQVAVSASNGLICILYIYIYLRQTHLDGYVMAA